jgi:hypothetical protein
MSDMIAYEEGELDEDQEIEMFQKMINDGSVWHFQGCYGRQAMALIESGQCVLGEVGHRDYWGNYIPSRTEVKAGTKGSLEYQERMLESR